ncbi:Ca2+-binding RTX toxin-like protein [Rhizobium sp. SG_E_25_P2]|uniref:cadherin domain-containing protein n=1 Tax=Rhizobium sp. SG_E_25_P2 TaxID=2879942 RepID=UPI00247699A7|nr:cadherin domain-containing protein [Rhizobium sp. SG_E_25_P2]MDH6265512.1 Ca2+-binding RTX toxin-like protein [Rhizobium sp. SG_E_25_P2]
MANDIPGTGNSETLYGSAADDYFTPGGGNDLVLGGEGTDTAVLTGSSYDYAVSISKSIINGVYFFTVKTSDLRDGKPDGKDEFRFVEHLQFSNGVWDVDDGDGTTLNYRPRNIALNKYDINENEKPGSSFAEVSATDPEGGDISFSLVDSANGRFKLDGDRISATTKFDYEKQSTYKITISATDELGQTSLQTMSINILDVYELGDDIIGTKKNDTLTGTFKSEAIFGDGGKDKLSGLAGNDHLYGGAGADILAGGKGRDVFHFAEGDGRDIVTDFQVRGNADWIDLTDFTIFTSFDNIEFFYIKAHGDDTWIVDGKDTLILEGVKSSQLTASDFIL